MHFVFVYLWLSLFLLVFSGMITFLAIEHVLRITIIGLLFMNDDHVTHNYIEHS